MSDFDKWYRNYWARHALREKVYATLRAPCVSSAPMNQLNEQEMILFHRTQSSLRILDFGAGDNRLKRKFLAAGFRGCYETLDISDVKDHNYSSLSDVSGTFGAIFCLEVIEHISLNDYVDLMDKFETLLEPGGVLAVGTPNPLSVIPMWAGDAGHVQQYPLADLVADLMVRGYDVEAFRVRYGAWPGGLGPRLRLLATRVLTYLLGVDYAQGIFVIGRKKASPTEGLGEESHYTRGCQQ